jgi:hypothetical protein
MLFSYLLLYTLKLAAYTELYAGQSGDILLEWNRCCVMPCRRMHDSLKEDLMKAMKRVDNGGMGGQRSSWSSVKGE